MVVSNVVSRALGPTLGPFVQRPIGAAAEPGCGESAPRGVCRSACAARLPELPPRDGRSRLRHGHSPGALARGASPGGLGRPRSPAAHGEDRRPRDRRRRHPRRPRRRRPGILARGPGGARAAGFLGRGADRSPGVARRLPGRAAPVGAARRRGAARGRPVRDRPERRAGARGGADAGDARRAGGLPDAAGWGTAPGRGGGRENGEPRGRRALAGPRARAWTTYSPASCRRRARWSAPATRRSASSTPTGTSSPSS